jgi:hypothetical protein
MDLAKKYPKLKFVVQDLPEPVELGEKDLPTEYKDQISFQVHDFLTPQPVKADMCMK